MELCSQAGRPVSGLSEGRVLEPLAEKERLRERGSVHFDCSHRYLSGLQSKAWDQGESQGVN